MESYLIHDLTFTYPGRVIPALRGVSIEIGQGQFVTLCGPSGGGKTTLLRLLKPILAPHGERSGEISFCGKPVDDLDQRTQSEKIGFVLQSVDNQLVTDKVWHELAFGLESLGYPTSEIRLKVAEMAAFFGIEAWFYKNVNELSGGQKQLLNLASVMVMQPSVLMLDEPTSQLDPIAAADFLATVGKINRELGVTVIMTEHRLGEVFPLSDRVVCLDAGRVVGDGSPRRVGEILHGLGHSMFLAMPAPMQIWAGLRGAGAVKPDYEGECPVTVRDGRVWFDRLPDNGGVEPGDTAERAGTRLQPEPGHGEARDDVIEIKDVWFRYERESPDVIRRLSLTVGKGEFLCIVGGNGAGKTTALMLIAGLGKPQRGTIRLFGENVLDIPAGRLFSDSGDGGIIGILPQNPQALFVKKTVREDLLEIYLGRKVSREDKEKRLGYVSALCHLEELLDLHPYDLSGGEQQRAALAKILLLRPRILLLDEPTKGLDAGFKREFAEILRNLAADGVAIVLVSHDIEFCAEHADRCAMFFDGSIVTQGPPRDFFSGNSFYTTASNRIVRHRLPRAITTDDVLYALGLSSGKPEDGDAGDSSGANPKTENGNPDGAGPVAERAVETAAEGTAESATEDAAETAAEDTAESATESAAETAAEDSGSPKAAQPPNAAPAASGPGPGSFIRRFGALPYWRKTAAAISAILLLGVITMIILNISGFLSFVSGGSEAERIIQEPGVWRYAVMLIALCTTCFALALSLPGTKKLPSFAYTQAKENRARAVPKRTALAAVMILLAIPLTIFFGVSFLDDRRYYFISMLIIIETILPFILIFEGRKPQAREIVVIAVLCALGIAGRTAFFMLPHVKPIAALAIITGVAFGGEAGFLFGAMTGFLSNMFFGQGPWTPWQMFAYGLIGFLAGIMFKKGPLARNRTVLCIYGGLAAFVLYGGLMNVSSIFMYQEHPTPGMFLVYLVQGIPLDLVHAASTVMFLGILVNPMLEKLDRLKLKYGLLE